MDTNDARATVSTPFAEASAPLFSLRELTVELDGRPVIHPITLDVEAGRITGLLGQNGSGKSTLLRTLARQIGPSGGTARFAGRPLDEWSGRDYARRIAYLPQYPPVATGLLAEELVAIGRYPWHGALGRFGEMDQAKVREAMELTHTTSFARRQLDTLSGGERQRVWLAMLVAQDAGCFLLDEPISALDIAHQMEVLALVRELSRARGIGVLMVLHDVNMAARFCDRIVALRGGRLVVSADAADFMTPDCLASIYDVDMIVRQDEETGLRYALPRG